MVDKEMMAFSLSLSCFLEEVLQCDAPIIKEIGQMHRVSLPSLVVLQGCVMKSLEAKW